MRTSTIAVIVTLVVAGIALGYGPTEAAPAYQQCNNTEITSPSSGDEVRGVVPIEGSASIPEFQFYKVEYSTSDQPNFWRAVSQTYEQARIDAVLDRWNTEVVPDGEYSLKLTVVDNRAQEVCRAFVRDLTVANTQPTATPTPEAPPTLPGPTATLTPRATVTPVVAIPTPTIAAIIPTRQPLFPELDTVRQTVSGAFDVERLEELWMLGAGTATAVFIFIGLISLLRRLI